MDEHALAESGDPRLFFDPDVAMSAGVANNGLVGDLRIDNSAELTGLLGLDLASTDDAVLVLCAFQKWGIDCFARIEGDFAIAIWDAAERRLILARDAIGQRPLHYRQIEGGIVFASLPIELAALAGVPAADLVQLISRLTFMPQTGDRSFVKGVKRVQPGHVVIAGSTGDIVEKRWWQPDLSPLRISHDDAVEAVAEQLRSTTSAMVRTDAPTVASDLSGGLDSSIVVATAAGVIDSRERLVALTGVAAGPVDSPPRLFADESARAAETAAINGVRHQIVKAWPESPFAALDRWLPTTQEPIPNACNLGWIDACYDAARQAGAKVYLTGGRGNFTVTRPGMARLGELTRSGSFVDLARELWVYRRFAGGGWPGLLAMSFGHLLPDRVWNVIAPVAHRRDSSLDVARGTLLRDNPAVRAAIDQLKSETSQDVGALFADESPLARWRVAASLDDGVGNLSVRRRHGLELREPLIAKRVIELCMRLPTASYFRDGRPRALARDLLKGKTGTSVIDEPRRGWQGANWRAGFEPARAEMASEIERIADDPQLAELIDTQRMRSILEAWPREGWNDWSQIFTYRSTLVPVIGAARFARLVREWSPGA